MRMRPAARAMRCVMPLSGDVDISAWPRASKWVSFSLSCLQREPARRVGTLARTNYHSIMHCAYSRVFVARHSRRVAQGLPTSARWAAGFTPLQERRLVRKHHALEIRADRSYYDGEATDYITAWASASRSGTHGPRQDFSSS